MPASSSSKPIGAPRNWSRAGRRYRALAREALADDDPSAAGEGQADSGRGLAHGVDAPEHEFSRDVRERAVRERGAQGQLQAARDRDEAADARDRAALARDQAADARDRAMAQRDATHERETGSRAVTDAQIVMRAADERKRAAQHRAQAAEQRERAARDRQLAAENLDAAVAWSRRRARGAAGRGERRVIAFFDSYLLGRSSHRFTAVGCG